MKSFAFAKQLIVFLVALTLLTACSTTTQNSLHRQQFIDGMRVPDYFLGGAESYCYGTKNDKTYFEANIEKAQTSFEQSLTDRSWSPASTGSHSCTWGGQQYYRLTSARWKLKDGREFIVEKLDVRAYMREFFKTQDTVMQWIKDGRPKGVGDGEPGVLIEFRDNTIVLHWVDQLNDVPFADRLKPDAQYPKGRYLAKHRNVFYPVATIKGTPTSNVDFAKMWEFYKR